MKKIIFFTILINSLIFAALEWFSGNIITNKNIYGIIGLMEKHHPFMEYDENLGYRIRKAAMDKETKSFPIEVQTIMKGKLNKVVSKKLISTKLNFNKKEGIIRNENGDIAINSLGYRGPYFVKKKDSNIFRIVTMGGSTTAGMHENELTYPRILERMLNQSKTKKEYFQVINAGMWGHNTCQIKTRFQNEIIELKPDLLVLMSGWNDINKFRSADITNSRDYCESHHPLLIKSNIFRLLRLEIIELVKKTNSELGFNVLKKNLDLYENNLREIAEKTKEKNIKLILMGLPGVYEKNSVKNFKEYVQFGNMNTRELTYRQKALLSTSEIKIKLAREYPHASYVDNGLSINIPGKNDFFFDPVHPTGSGNRIMAFKLLEPIIGLVNNNKINISKASWSNNKLELDYLKSIFASNRIEDLAGSGCVALSKTFCSSSHKNLKVFIYVRAINEFALGSLLQFHEDTKKPKLFRKLESLLKKSILMSPDNSITPWILSCLYLIIKEENLSKKYLLKSIQLNPLLKNISFEKERLKFQKNYKQNPFISDYLEFVKAIKQGSDPNYKFVLFNSLPESKNISNKTKNMFVMQHVNFYWANPILGRSIFLSLINHLNLNNEYQLAKGIKARADLLGFPYGWN
ncbi:GDSL-type esterase/lipase family protein [Nitrospinae bacterium]|nr:GDSL-type esterase/lipase family protein [Nitrospinota bacterium]